MSQEKVEIVRRAYESLARRDWDGLWADAHSDFQLHTQLQGSYRGPDEAQRFAEDRFAAFESWEAEPEEFFESDDQVVGTFRFRPSSRADLRDSDALSRVGFAWS